MSDIGEIIFTKSSNGLKFAVNWPAKLTNNSDKMIVACSGDQFGITDYKQTQDGFELSLYGPWEMHAFLQAMAQAAEAHGLGTWHDREVL